MAFSNPIVAGDRLIIVAIQSEIFDAENGWRIERDGDATLNTVTTRGSWRVQNAASGDAYIEGGITGNVPYIKWNGLVGLSPVSVLAQMVGTVDVGRLRIAPEPLASNAALSLAEGVGIVLEGESGVRSILFDKDDAFLKLGTFAPWVAEGWQNLSLSGLWIADTQAPQYKLLPDGRVILRGWIRNGTTASTTVMATLPVGYRPLTNAYFTCAKPNQNLIQATVDVTTGGAIRVIAISNQAAAATASISLDSITFSTI